MSRKNQHPKSFSVPHDYWIHCRIRVMSISTKECVFLLALLGVAFFVSPVASLGIRASSLRTNPTSSFSSTRLLAEQNQSMNSIVSRRLLLGAVLATVVTTTGGTAQAETNKSNFNYELGNAECQTSCVVKCQQNNSNKNITDDCIDACVRSGQRYCHQPTTSKWSPSAEEATSSRYVITTMEPTIKTSKPIPGLKYNSNRGGAWRD